MSDQQKNVISNKEIMSFVFIELCVFIAQVLIIFIVAYFISDSLDSEKRLTEFVNGKVNSATMKELGLTLFSATFVLGLLTLAKEFIPSKFVETISSEIILELPRTIYLFGSSITASTLAIASFLSSHPEVTTRPTPNYLWASAFFAVSFFTYGCAIKLILLIKQKHSSKA